MRKSPTRSKKNVSYYYSLLFASALVLGTVACSETAPLISSDKKEIQTSQSKEKLNLLLDSLVYDDSNIQSYPSKISDGGTGFYQFEADGRFYHADSASKTYLEVGYDSNTKTYVFYDSTTKAPFANSLNLIELDSLATHFRAHGTYRFKTKNRDCFYTVAKQRLKTSTEDEVYERLYAMERPTNPRPLLFTSDKQWEEFKGDLVDLFQPFSGPDSFIEIRGTSTTFISQNPTKGVSQNLFDPGCDTSATTYTFDTPGKDPSDLDITLFIPSLSTLCHSVQFIPRRTPVKGNDGVRECYWENHLDRCLSESTDSAAKSLVQAPFNVLAPFVISKRIDPKTNAPQVYNKVHELMKAPQIHLPENKLFRTANGKLLAFVKKWDSELKQREINFSVRILPDHILPLNHPKAIHGSRQLPGVLDFSGDSALKSRFIIPIR